MLDFTPVRKKEITMNELAEGLTLGDLRSLTNEMVDHVLNLIKDCTDADVVFEPEDPMADDKAAATAATKRSISSFVFVSVTQTSIALFSSG